jgi:hypothetical protein
MCCNQSAKTVFRPTIKGIMKGATAITKNALHIGLATSVTIANREDLCMKCLYKQDGIVAICSKCSCIIQEKIRQASSQCPLNPPSWTYEI